MALAFNRYRNLFSKGKRLAKSPDKQHILEISAEPDNMKDTNIKLVEVIKSKVTPSGKTKYLVNQESNKKKSQKNKNYDKYDWKQILPKQGKIYIKTICDNTYNWCKSHK